MKKSLLATAILGLATATCANAAQYSVQPAPMQNQDSSNAVVMPYAQLDLGATNLAMDDNSVDVDNKTSFAQRLTLGLDFQGDRIGLDFTNFGHFKWHEVNGYDADLTLNVYGVGVSYTHSMLLNSSIRPYIGARIGYTHFKLKSDGDSVSKNHASFGGFGGVEFDVARNVTFGVGAEYDQLWANSASDISGNAFMRVYF